MESLSPQRRQSADWINQAGDPISLRWRSGQIQTKNPENDTIRRLLGLATVLDAWVIGDEDEVYKVDTDGAVAADRLDGVSLGPDDDTLCIARDGEPVDRIGHEEWLGVARQQPDFRIESSIGARLPSGVARIACTPYAVWTGHPSGRSTPFFFDFKVDRIEVRHVDDVTELRMLELASLLDALVVDY